MCDLKELNSDLEALASGKIGDLGDLSKSEAWALHDIFSKRYLVIGPSEDKYHPGKYALDFQKKNPDGGIN